MKRAWNISGSLREHLIQNASPPPPSQKLTIFPAQQPFSSFVTATVPTTADFRLTRGICDEPSSSPSSDSIQRNNLKLLTVKPTTADKSTRRIHDRPSSFPSSESFKHKSFRLLNETFRAIDKITVEEMEQVSMLRDELLKCHEKYPNDLLRVLDEKALAFLESYPSAPAFAELLEQLRTRPALALEVLDWRRNQGSLGFPMKAEEYSKAITISGRARNINLAYELFTEAANLRVKTTSTYNSMLGAYMVNGLANKCQDLFQRFKEEENCRPNIVTYNILISVFGRLMMVDQMEDILKEIEDRDLFPTLYTYNYLIAGYLTAWSWDEMEKTFMRMKDSHVTPNLETYFYMLRGYSYAGKLDKMEQIFELITEQSTQTSAAVRCMISGYCQSFRPDRVSRIDELLRLLSEDEYCPWLHVKLIQLYAEEDMLEKMESMINEALERRTAVGAVNVMRSVVTSYFRLNAVDKLKWFVKRAEAAGWRLSRSIFHCQMVMYGGQNRLEEMEEVLTAMERFCISPRTKRTFCILYKAYMKWGQKQKAEKIVGLLCKCGYDFPEDLYVS